MDSNGHIWLVGRTKWRVHDVKTGLTFWSTVVEQKVCVRSRCLFSNLLIKILERTSKITFVSYLINNKKSYLFIEAPDGLPDKEQKGK